MPTGPLVTIGVPTFNESEFLGETMKNLVTQSYLNLEIIIADNGSTDATRELCEKAITENERIRYIRHEKNIGQNANFNLLPREAKGKYFLWAAGHDLLSLDFVEKSVQVLESDEKIVLAYPRTFEMSRDGIKIGQEVRRPFDIQNMNASQRFREVMWRVDCNFVYGMFRSGAMKQSRLFQLVPAADRVFLAEMAIKGTFAPSGAIRYCRSNRGRKQNEIEKRRRLMAYIHPDQTFTDKKLLHRSFYIPSTRAFHTAVRESSLSFVTKAHLHLSISLASTIKSHTLPGSDLMSSVVRRILPQSVLKAILSKMQ
jgi:glycosyltransferase involved in cell wall biosynthesis